MTFLSLGTPNRSGVWGTGPNRDPWARTRGLPTPAVVNPQTRVRTLRAYPGWGMASEPIMPITAATVASR